MRVVFLDIDGAVLVLSSDWRRGRDLAVLADELQSAGIDGRLLDGRSAARTGAHIAAQDRQRHDGPCP